MNRVSTPTLLGKGSLLALAALSLGGMLAAMQVPPLRLTGAQEVPAVQTTATATSTISVTGEGVVTGVIETAGITGTMAHIHQGAAGVNGPVIVTLEKSGTNRWLVPAGTHITEAQYTDYKAGGLYINVHSYAHKNGELRLQLIG
jgi:hypothetical protein